MSTLTNLGDVARLIKEASTERPRTIIGVVGPSAAGTSTIAAKLVQLLGPSSTAVGLDGFHYSQETLEMRGRLERMGAPITSSTWPSDPAFRPGRVRIRRPSAIDYEAGSPAGSATGTAPVTG